AMADRLGDLVELAAPNPVIVIEVRIALGAAAARAVAGCAVLGEGWAPLRARKLEELLIRDDLLQRCRRKLGDHRPAPRLWRIELGHHRLTRMPVEHAGRIGADERP